jgi:hypothetical protein
MNYDQLTTVICPTSPSPLHPDTRIIDETLRSVRYWFPTALVYILADGVRPELEHRRRAYEEYQLRLLCNLPDQRTYVVPHSSHRHQTAMVKGILPIVDTPLLLWIEQDLPIRTDIDIDWRMMADAILSGQVDLCRLMLTEQVHPEHEYLYQPPLPDDYPHLRPSRQWSGWTHLASTAMYRRLLKDFNPAARIMVERYVGRILEARPWSDFKLTSYVPDPIAARRIYHLHGRGGVDGQPDDSTFVETEIYPPK